MSKTATKHPDPVRIDAAMASRLLPRREPGAHKWGVGGLLVVAGGPTYVGAAALVAMAAGRAGAGIVNLAVPRGAVGAIAALVPEAVFVPLAEGDPDAAARRGAEAIRERMERCAALAIGPGLGDDEHAHALLEVLFAGRRAPKATSLGFRAAPAARSADAGAAVVGAGKPALVDADALNWLSTREEWWAGLPAASLLLTPHAGEMARLRGVDSDAILSDPIGHAVALARETKQVVLLKGAPSFVTDGDRLLVADETPPSLASAGTGDVLAGTAGALLAQGLGPVDAAALALYVGTRAARAVERDFGTLGLVASDLPAAVAREMRQLEHGEV